jgi:hypothetical protein
MDIATTLVSNITLNELASIPEIEVYAGYSTIHFGFSHGEIGRLSRLIIKRCAPEVFCSKTRNLQLTYECILYNLIVCAFASARENKDIWIALSRNRNKYKRAPFQYGGHHRNHITYTSMISALERLKAEGILEQKLGHKSDGFEKGVNTLIRPTTAFLSMLGGFADVLEFKALRERGLILLRDKMRALTKFVMDKSKKLLLEDLTKVNANNAQHRYEYMRRNLVPRTLDPESLRFNVCFRPDFAHGGRWYADVQNLPREDRKTLTINGEPTCELDFSGLHPTMLYHMRGQTLLEKAYAIPGIDSFNRPAIKKNAS